SRSRAAVMVVTVAPERCRSGSGGAACGAAGRRRVLSRYGWGQVAAATETAYCEVLDAEPAATGAG
ncbi:hypothetical protein ABZY29_41330, partial [Streptomyces coeruleorubidus]